MVFTYIDYLNKHYIVTTHVLILKMHFQKETPSWQKGRADLRDRA